jgi:hypothetical protein
MSASTTKVFTITGDAASAIGGTRKRRKRSTARGETMKVGKDQHGGTSPGTSLQVMASRPPGGAEPPSVNFQKSTGGELTKVSTESSPAPAQAQSGGNPPVKLVPKVTPAPPPLEQAGGSSKPVKVILEKKKKGTRVVLAPTKVKKLNTISYVPPTKSQTRKVAKKIRMSLNGFGKRVTRANTIRVDAKKQNVEDVKKTLVEAKLIKETSKAPEGVLRQMYSDYMMLKNRAL